MSRKHPDSYERKLPNRRRELIKYLEILEYANDPYEFEEWVSVMDELEEVEREMHIRPRKRRTYYRLRR